MLDQRVVPAKARKRVVRSVAAGRERLRQRRPGAPARFADFRGREETRQDGEAGSLEAVRRGLVHRPILAERAGLKHWHQAPVFQA